VSGARINVDTEFSDESNLPKCVYEVDQESTIRGQKETHPLKAAEWVYRRLESLHEQNVQSERARQYHISKQEVRRKYYRERRTASKEELIDSFTQSSADVTKQRSFRELIKWNSLYSVSTLQWHLTRHGESLKQILFASGALIFLCGLLYPLVGGVKSSSAGKAYTYVRITLNKSGQIYYPSLSVQVNGVAEFVETLFQGFYFSIITFTTIGYGDLYPTGILSKLLVGFESLAGALLIALFVFVLGRRVSR
jgi:hypothetical protein